MFLRWHYLVDICAGIALAVSAIVVSGIALKWDALREQQGGGPVWPRYGSTEAATAPVPAE